jgi:chloramphenicol 3-O phosphotransferase
MPRPDVIFLNGATSAGKSTLALSLQKRLPETWLRFSVDDPLQRAPLRLHDNPQGFQFQTRADGAVALNIGPEGERLLHAWRRMLRAAVDAGQRLILDEVILSPAILRDWLTVFEGCDVFFVGVRCELAELQRREVARGDRMPGQALWMHGLVHAHGHYDLEVDSTSSPAGAMAQTIIGALDAPPELRAFDRLRASSSAVSAAPPSP